MAKVAPEQHVMKPCPEQAELIPQRKIPGNGCCCTCCGAGPGDIQVAAIKKHGNACTRWIQKQDGRIIEYYVYGSEQSDARIFLQVNGSMGSAKFFSEMPSMVSVLKEKNVRAIAVNIAGHGFTSGDPLRRMGDWAKSDVEPVLKAEGIPDDALLIIEGSSFGSAHCHALMHHFQHRITRAHFHVPALAQYLSPDLGLKKISEGGSCTGKYATTCFLKPGNCCSPCLFCCCSSLSPCMPAGANGLNKMPDYAKIKEAHGFEASEVMKTHSIHGLVYNFFLGQIYKDWGFHPFDDIKVEHVEKMMIVVSYGEKDRSSPESHGEYMASYYSKMCNENGTIFKNVKPEDVVGNQKGGRCLVNHGPGGHDAHFVPFCNGDLLRALLEL